MRMCPRSGEIFSIISITIGWNFFFHFVAPDATSNSLITPMPDTEASTDYVKTIIKI